MANALIRSTSLYNVIEHRIEMSKNSEGIYDKYNKTRVA